MGHPKFVSGLTDLGVEHPILVCGWIDAGPKVFPTELGSFPQPPRVAGISVRCYAQEVANER